MLVEKRYAAPEMLTFQVLFNSGQDVARVLLQNQRVDYGRYDKQCDVYSLAITLTEALPAPVEGTNDTVALQRPYFFLYSATGNAVPNFIRDGIIAAVCW